MMQWTQRLPSTVLVTLFATGLPTVLLTASPGGPALAQSADLYRDVVVVLHPTDGSAVEALTDLTGPTLEDLVADGVAAIDVPGTSTPRPELLTHTSQSGTTVITWTDLDTVAGEVESGEIDPPPPVAFVALTAIDATGDLQRDLVGATAEELWQLDIVAAEPRWQARPAAPGAPSTYRALAAADVTGDTLEQLVATDGASLFVTEPKAAEPVWTPLTGPAGVDAIDALTSSDVGLLIGAVGEPPERRIVRVLTVHFGGLSWYYLPDPVTGLPAWSEPRTRRFLVASSAPSGPASGPDDGVGDVLLPLPLATTEIRLENVVDPGSALASPFDPLGDGHCPGAVFSDLDNDGLPDLYLPRGKATGEPMDPSREALNWFFRNRGDGTFVAAGEAADDGNGAGALAADFDNDGLRDLFVINFGEANVLYRQTASGFVDVTADTDPTDADDVQAGLAYGRPASEEERPPDCTGPLADCRLDDSLAAAAGDFDRDGYLDLYVGNHLCCDYADGQRDVLYLNDGDADGAPGWDGTFTDFTTAAGIETDPADVHKSTQAVLVADLDANGWPDVYVAVKGNSGGDCGSRDRLYLNDGDVDGVPGWDGTFSDWYATLPGSCAEPGSLGNFTGAAMGIDAGDFDNDGDLDLFLTDIGQMDLYRNLLSETGSFGLELAVDPSDPERQLLASPDWGWGTSWTDYDNDGDLDLHVATADHLMSYLQRNDGDGIFTDVTLAAGAGQAWESRASVTADLDADGQVDLLHTHRGRRPIDLLRNATANPNRWLQVALTGDPDAAGAPYRSTRDAVGARVLVEIASAGGATRRQQREVRVGGHSCASTRDYVVSFGLGVVEPTDSVTFTVFWPSGRVSSREVSTLDQRLRLVEPGGG